MALAADDWDAPLGQQAEPERDPHDFKRDKRGTPYVSHPDGKVCASGARKGEVQWVRYGRPSSFGKEIENTYNLQRWNERQIAIGMTIEDHTLTDWLLKLADLDPESEEGKDAADAIVVQSKRLAKAGLAADRGTHMHAVTEDDDQEADWVKRCENGEILDLPREVQEAMLEAWRLMCMAYDLEILDVERRVVHDRWHQAGTLDRRVRLRSDITFENGITLEAGTVILFDLKGLALNTPIPTPTGWTTMGSIVVGDQVIGSDGKPCNVLFKSELRDRPCYRITFHDGTSVVADDEHRWAVDTARVGPQVLTTAELARSQFGSNGQRQHRVVNAAPLALPESDLPLDPYVLGLWLGDGKHTSGEISKPIDSGIWTEITRRGFFLGKPYQDKRNNCASYTVLGLRTALREMGLLGHKHVPDAYLRASESQRLDLLRGLMDSDGTWNKARNRAQFTSTDKALALAVYELVVSLGERAHLAEILRSGFGVTVMAYDVEWAPSVHLPFAELAKAARATTRDTGHNTRRMIVSVDEVPSVPTQCIAVDSPDHTYLCTESMVVTHNTGKLNDAKGKSKLDQGYWHSYAVQCVTYADGVPYDCDTDTRGEWDEPMCSEWAIIAHLPVDEALEGKATCRLVLVDIAAARTVVEEVVLKAKAWQARRDLFAHTADEPTIEVDVVFPVDRGVNHVWNNEPAPPVPPPTEVLERPSVTDEGGVMNDQQLAEIRKRATGLHPEAKAMLDMLAKQAAAAGYPFSIGAGPTMRRWHIYRALLRLAVHYEGDLQDEFIRATLALVLPDVEQPAVILGPAIGSLTIDEAQRFVQAAIQVIAQDAVLTIDDAGRPKWAGFDNTAA